MSPSKKKGKSRAAKPAPRRPRRYAWARLEDEDLLEVRLRDLGVAIERTPIKPRVERLWAELERRGLAFKPHVWLSTEWFSPDGIPGIAIPFYLAHPRLMKLEARQMLEVEGGTARSSARILRHEAGHAIDTAYRLHFKKGWREVFGNYSQRYPRYYRPKPNSRSHVLHLDSWYAQAHPAEDFAETFAVWLTPGSRWRETYADWPQALRKLEYVDRVMRESVGRNPPLVRSRAHIESLQQTRTTLGEHYRRKRNHYGASWPETYDGDLRRLFSDDKRHAARPSASSFLRGMRAEIRIHVARYTGVHPYTIDQVLGELIERCRQLRLRLAGSPRMARTQAIILLTVHTMNLIRGRRHEIPL